MPQHGRNSEDPAFVEEKIVDGTGALVGTVRLRPSSILWKPEGADEFHQVTFEEFEARVTSASQAASREET